MSINWGVLIIVAITLLVLVVLAVVTVMYIRHWASRHELNEVEPGSGKYFKRYFDERDRAVMKLSQETILESRRKSLRRIKWGATVAFIAVLVIGSSLSLYVNRDTLVAKVELEDVDLTNLRTARHEWDRVYPEQLPNLKQQLARLKTRGIILLGNSAKKTSGKLENLRQNSLYTWQRFARDNRIVTLPCEWSELSACQQKFHGWLFVVLPDQWDPPQINGLLNSGESVLLYDAPFQVIDKSQGGNFRLYDLVFTAALDQSDSVMALAGDRELTLGFDAGTIIEIGSNRHDYKASAERPQALAIDSGRFAGAELRARLYAKAKGAGRLVWMDFSPNLESHGSSVSQRHFNGLLAAILRYLNKESYQGIATWPQARPFSALLEEDTEDGYNEAGRVADFFAENNYPVTWYILSNEAERSRALTRKLAAAGEVACHGDNHQPFTLNDERTQHERIALCRKAIEQITGQQVTSFRPPEEKFSGKTLDAIANNGIASFIAERGIDRFVPTVMKSRLDGSELVSLPRMVLDDYGLWHKMEADLALSKRLTAQQIDYVNAVGGLYMFSFHTQFMADDDNFAAVQFIANTVNKKRAWMATSTQIANWWKFRSRLMAGKNVNPEDVVAFQPVVLHVDKHGKMFAQPYSGMTTVSN